jgi:hypothetical protein
MNKKDLLALCKDCEIDTFEIDEYYMVNDEIWNKIAPDDENKIDYFLCIGCIENRLGRELVQQDFPMDIPVNSRGKHSSRLQNRINSKIKD